MTGSLFRGIIPEKYRYFSGNFRKNSAGNFLTHNPTSNNMLRFLLIIQCEIVAFHFAQQSDFPLMYKIGLALIEEIILSVLDNKSPKNTTKQGVPASEG